MSEVCIARAQSVCIRDAQLAGPRVVPLRFQPRWCDGSAVALLVRMNRRNYLVLAALSLGPAVVACGSDDAVSADPDADAVGEALQADNGVLGDYFTSDTFGSAPAASRYESKIDASWGTDAPIGGVPSEGFGVRWTAQLAPRDTSEHTFTVTADADAGVRLWIGTTLLLDAWTAGACAKGCTSKAIALTEDARVSLRLEYAARKGDAQVELAWSSGGRSARRISASRYFRPTSVPTPSVDAGAGAPPVTPALTPTPSATCSGVHDRVVDVATGPQLVSALANAKPGDAIVLASGTYQGKLEAAASGTAAKPIALCGGAGAVLSGSPYGLHVTGSYWYLAGFSVTNASKGVVLDGASHVVADGLTVHGIEQEGFHFRAFSADNVLRNSRIYDTGQKTPAYGEGVYMGSAKSNWGTYSNGQPDRSDRNQVIGNTIGPNVAAESVDIKEGSTGGLVSGNTFLGKGMAGQNYADSWIDAKGNAYVIEDNKGTDALEDGFQVHVAEAGWGENNVFRRNTATVNAPGYGFNVAAKNTNTIVACSNVVTGAKSGFANVACTP